MVVGGDDPPQSKGPPARHGTVTVRILVHVGRDGRSLACEDTPAIMRSLVLAMAFSQSSSTGIRKPAVHVRTRAPT